jgi:hypothetical protein
MSFQQLQLTAAQRFAQVKLTPSQALQRQTWEKEGYKLAENQAAIPKGAEQRTFSIPGRLNPIAVANGRAGASIPTGGSSFLFYKGGQEEAKPAAAAAPPPAAAPAAAAPSHTVPGNPTLSIPGIDVRLTGEQVGIKPAESTERKARSTSAGTSKLTIPRSSGASGLNIG